MAVGEHRIGDLAEVLDNLGVFRAHPTDVADLCPSGFRRVPISTGPDYYLSLQCLGPEQIAFAHTHPDSEEWVVVLGGDGEARFGPNPVPLGPGVVVGRGAKHPHRVTAGPGGLQRLAAPGPSTPTGSPQARMVSSSCRSSSLGRKRAQPRGTNPGRPPTRSTALRGGSGAGGAGGGVAAAP